MTLVPNYVPTDWVDTVTPVDEAHMDKLDVAVDQHADAINGLDTRMVTQEAKPALPAVVNGKWIKGVGGAAVWSDITIADVASLQTSLNAKQDTSAKGAASGYAPLDSSSKVPAANLPTPIDLRYAGAYAAGTPYKEGDVVIYNGIAYMALRATTGETPVPWSTTASSLTSVTNALAADVALTVAGTYYDGPAVALTVGTWLLVGTIQVTRAGNAGFVTGKLWDGTNVGGVSEFHSSQLASGQGNTLAVNAIVVVSANVTWKISAQSSGTGHIMRAAAQSGGTPTPASSLDAVKIG